jgi:hypothetical protein
MSDLRALIGEQLSEVLDVIDDDADSVVVRIEVSAGRAGESAPPLCHEFTLRVVSGEWQGVRSWVTVRPSRSVAPRRRLRAGAANS